MPTAPSATTSSVRTRTHLCRSDSTFERYPLHRRKNLVPGLQQNHSMECSTLQSSCILTQPLHGTRVIVFTTESQHNSRPSKMGHNDRKSRDRGKNDGFNGVNERIPFSFLPHSLLFPRQWLASPLLPPHLLSPEGLRKNREGWTLVTESETQLLHTTYAFY